MLRALWFLLKLGLLLAAVLWLAGHFGGTGDQGRVEIVWQGYLVETKPAVLVAGLALLLLVWTFVYRLWRVIIELPARLGKKYDAHAREDAYRALTRGLVAIAAGDGVRAKKMAMRAQKVLPDAPLTRLLTAQTALLEGDLPRARRGFQELLDDPEGAFFGVRGLLNEALEQRQYGEAIAYLRQADRLQPKRPWILRSLFDAEVKNRDWVGAHQTLRRLHRVRAMEDSAVVRARAVVWLAQAIDILADENLPPKSRLSEAQRFALAAYRLDTAFTPAVLVLADCYVRADKRYAALKIINRGWENAPHPQLMALWKRLAPPVKKMATPLDAAKAAADWVGQLANLRPEHRDSQRALGLALLEARDARRARPLLEAVGEYRALAALEESEGMDKDAARRWLEKAAEALPPNQWVCSHCGHAQDDWQPLCQRCDSFDSFDWRQAGGPALARLVTPAAAAGGMDILSPPR